MIITLRWITRVRKRVARRAIGTTGRGIGPAYEDKVARRGLVWRPFRQRNLR
ncbi:adenylosuccinate synthetase [Shigella sonnei]